MQRFEFYLSYQCSNNCVFCSVSNQMRAFGDYPVTLEEATKELTSKRRAGCTSVCLTGGEPTIYPHFLDVLKVSKLLGYRVEVTTDGTAFSSRSFCKRALPYIDELQLSVHGHEEKLHNLHTRNGNNFANVAGALDNLNSMGDGSVVRLSSNVMVTRFNVDHLVDIAKFLSSYSSIRQVMVSNVAPEGNGLDNFSEISVALTDLAPRIAPLVSYCESKGLAFRVFGVPLCILGPYRSHSNDLFWDGRITTERCWKNGRIGLESAMSMFPTRGRIRPRKCAPCLFNGDAVCGGLFRTYYDKHGCGELRPIGAGA